MIDYAKFGRLRFLDWFPENELYSPGSPGSLCAIGHATAEGYGFTYFARKAEQPEVTGELALDFGDDCPDEQGNRLLAFLGLNLAKGVSEHVAEADLGRPASRVARPDGYVFCRYVIGKSDLYYAHCDFNGAMGLQHILICRKDLADRFGNLENAL